MIISGFRGWGMIWVDHFRGQVREIKNRVTENSTQWQFWLSQSLLISFGSFIASFEPTPKI